MKPGDLVDVLKRNRWGSVSKTGQKALVVKRAYTAYDRDDSRWEVLKDGEIKTMIEKNLRIVDENR